MADFPENWMPCALNRCSKATEPFVRYGHVGQLFNRNGLRCKHREGEFFGLTVIGDRRQINADGCFRTQPRNLAAHPDRAVDCQKSNGLLASLRVTLCTVWV
jgi:hypothetical protein